MSQSIVIDRRHQIVQHILSRKGPCRAATTGNITLSGLKVVDGVQLADNDRVLVKDQSNGLNGIFLCKSSDWERARDFNHGDHVLKGAKIFITDGTANAITDWYVTSANGTFPGRQSINFANLTLALNEAERSAGAISFTPVGNIAATNVQAAVEEVDAETQRLDADLTALAALTTNAAGRSVLELSDPNADRITFWDDSAGRFAHLSVGTGLAISDTTLNATTPVTSQVLLTSGSVVNATTLDIVLTTYTNYRITIFLTALIPLANNVNFQCQTSTDGGSTYDGGATDYAWAELFLIASLGGTIGDSGTSGDDVMIFSGAIGNGAGQNANIRIELFNQTLTNVTKTISADVIKHDQGGSIVRSTSVGARLSTADVDAVRFFMSSGGFSCNYAVYGVT